MPTKQEMPLRIRDSDLHVAVKGTAIVVCPRQTDNKRRVLVEDEAPHEKIEQTEQTEGTDKHAKAPRKRRTDTKILKTRTVDFYQFAKNGKGYELQIGGHDGIVAMSLRRIAKATRKASYLKQCLDLWDITTPQGDTVWYSNGKKPRAMSNMLSYFMNI